MLKSSFTRIIQKDEIYPAQYLQGLPAFTYRQAECFKAQQERCLKNDPNKISINLEIVPVPDRKDEYYVHNTSTYLKDVTCLENLDKQFTLPSWAKLVFESPFCGLQTYNYIETLNTSIQNDQSYDQPDGIGVE